MIEPKPKPVFVHRRRKKPGENSNTSPTLELPAIIRYRLGKEEDMQKRVRRDFETIMRSYFNLCPMPFMRKLWVGVLGYGAPHNNNRDAADLLDYDPLGRWVVNWPTEHAKAEYTGNVIATASGWTTIGDLRVGDYVFGSDGKPTKVLAKSEVILGRPCYKVAFQDGAEYVVDEGHLWAVFDEQFSHPRLPSGERPRGKDVVVTTKELYEKNSIASKGSKWKKSRYGVRIRPVLEMEDRDVSVDPWLLGYWLGNGATRDGSVSFGIKDGPFVRAEIEAAGYEVGVRSDPERLGIHGLQTELKNLGVLGNKHVPDSCLFAAAAQRLALLQGLMDSDGTVGKQRGRPQVSYSTTLPALRDAVLFLVRSLGWKPTVCESRAKIGDKDYGSYWNVIWTAFQDRSPFRMPRKTALLKDPPETKSRSLTNKVASVEPVESVPVQCIKVEAEDGVYLTGAHLTATHNSTSLNVLFPLLSLMENPNNAHILACSNAREASRWLAAFKWHIESNPYLTRDFPWLKKPPARGAKKWSTHEVTIEGRDSSNANPSYVAFGWTADDFKGRRGKFVGDDMEGYVGSIASNEREKLYDKIQIEIARCIEDEGMGADRPLLLIAGTPFDVSSIYFRLPEDHSWKVHRQPYRYPDGSLIWAAKSGKIAQLKRSLNRKQFSIAMRLDPTGGDDSALTNERLRELTHADGTAFESKHLTYVVFDPAGGSGNARVDYAGIAVVKVRWPISEILPEVEVHRPVAFTGGPIDQVHYIAQLATEYDCEVIYEVNGEQGHLYQTLFEHFHPGEVRLVRHFTSGTKKFDPHTGVMVIRDLVIKGKLKIVEEGTDPEGVRALREEIKNLGTKAHDHLCHAIWFGFRYVYDHYRQSNGGYRLTPTFTPRVAGKGGLMGGVMTWPGLPRTE